MVIDIHRASIRTATVEIQAIKIDGKQMTLSVFRQLPRKETPGAYFDDAPIWGWVDYHSDCEWISEQSHMHMLWSDGYQLFHHLLRGNKDFITALEQRWPQLFIAV